MVAVWYPFDLFGPSAGIPWWVSVLVIIAFVLGCAFGIWLLRGR